MHYQAVYTLCTGEKVTCWADECYNEQHAIESEIDFQNSGYVLLVETIDHEWITVNPEYIVMTEYRFGN